MTDLKVSVSLADTITDLTAVASRAEDLTPVWEGPVDRILRGMFSETFASRGQNINAPWAPLSPVTEKLKSKAGRLGFGPLRFFDRMFRSLTVRSATDQIKVVTPSSLTFGTSVPYAHLHQEGWNMSKMFGRPVAPRFILPRKLAPEQGLPLSVGQEIESVMLDYVTSGALA